MDKLAARLLAFAEVTRPLNCAMAAFAAMLGYWLSVRALLMPAPLYFAAAATYAICAAGQTINDYYDFETDRKARSARPLPSGRISPAEAKSFAIALFILGIALSAYAGERALGIAGVFSILLFVYSSRLATLKYFGNAVVALGTAFTYVMGATISGSYLLVSFVAGASFFATWAREVAKDLEDFRADRGRKLTLPMIWGKTKARYMAKTVTYLAIAFGVVPYFLGLLSSTAYFVLVAAASVTFGYAAHLLKEERYTESQKTYKVAMLLALGAYASVLL